MAGRIDSIWTETLKRKAAELLVRKVKPIISVKPQDLDRYFIFTYNDTQLLLRFNYYDFAKNNGVIWRGDDPESYEKMLKGGVREDKKYFDSYEAFVDSGELVFLIEHKLTMTLLFQRLGKLTVKHKLSHERPLSRRRLAGPYNRLVEIFTQLKEGGFQKTKFVGSESDILLLKDDKRVVELLFFLSNMNSVLELEKLNEVVEFIIEINHRMRVLIRDPDFKMKPLLLTKKYKKYSAIEILFDRVMDVYEKLFEMIGKSEWKCRPLEKNF